MAITVQQVKKFNKKDLDPRTLTLFEICAQGYLDRESGDTSILQRSYDFAVANLDRILNEGYRVPEPEAKRAKTVTPRPAAAKVTAPQPVTTAVARKSATPPATDAQLRYVGKLMDQRDLTVRGKIDLPQLLIDRYQAGTLSKAQASELIGWLQEQPAKVAPVRLASERQLASVVKEGARRQYSDEATRTTVEAATAKQPVTFADASKALDVLFAAPFTPKPTTRRASNDLPDGFYVKDSEVYKVIVAHHGSGNKYAKVLDKTTGEWDIAPGAITKLTPDHAMTLAQALEVANVVAKDVDSRLYGRCFICSTVLTDEESIRDGIGPKCKKKFT